LDLYGISYKFLKLHRSGHQKQAPPEMQTIGTSKKAGCTSVIFAFTGRSEFEPPTLVGLHTHQACMANIRIAKSVP